MVPIIIGHTLNESTIFVAGIFPFYLSTNLYEAVVNRSYGPHFNEKILELYPSTPNPKDSFINFVTDMSFACKARQLSQIFAGHIQTYRYIFSHVPSYSRPAFGAHHGCEVNFPFAAQYDDRYMNINDLTVSDIMLKYWTDFAYGKQLKDWPVQTKGKDIYKRLDIKPEVIIPTKQESMYCDFWDSVASNIPHRLYLESSKWPIIDTTVNDYGLMGLRFYFANPLLAKVIMGGVVVILVLFSCCFRKSKNSKNTKEIKSHLIFMPIPSLLSLPSSLAVGT